MSQAYATHADIDAVLAIITAPVLNAHSITNP